VVNLEGDKGDSRMNAKSWHRRWCRW